ncbi:DeoR/GlpR family DNA-binding transcription regulator [Microbacterium sp. SD291]|uniref:DeoR/GlpR family DNA-binding transcription regulator n=1 Tax=Microbacterium sp. SD291 TaxID=2782007 RepID=UPI001A959B18|nr:DeoR/GlpR family DNA-binding transcription regulator [Microbacterium sp. SD291]MBO0979910.1 DeoR/GlpR transcriptional regulator [Microbacterium sp. SD291]
MLGVQRKDHLLSVLRREGRIVAKDAAAELGVSEDSIRRDLRELADAGACVRVYGGAVPVPAAEAPVEQRLTVATDSKQRVARAAVRLIRPASTIVLDAGTTTLAMARMLPHGAGLTVITPSPAVALAAMEHSQARVLMVGGELSRHSGVAGGALAQETIARLGADAFFLGVTGADPDAGLTTGELDDAVTKRALAARSADVFVLASAEKIGAVSRFPVVGLDEVAGIIADPADRNPLLERLGLLHPAE